MSNPYANSVPRQEDPYLNSDPWNSGEDFDLGSWEAGFDEDYELEAAPDYANQLQQLEAQIQRSPLTPEQQQQELANLTALEELLKNFQGEVPDTLASRIDETQERFVEKLSHLDQWQSSEQYITDLEQRLNQDATLDTEERDAYTKDITAAREALNEDPSIEVAELLIPLQEALDKIQAGTDAQVTEAERGQKMGKKIATLLDMKYAYGQVIGATGSVTNAETDGDLKPSANNQELGNRRVRVGNTTITIPKNRMKPKSELTHLPKPLQDYDILMKGASGLKGTRVPSTIINELYNGETSGAEKLTAIKSQLNTLPLGTQALILADVLAVVSEQDPEKLNFLKEYQPEILQYAKTTMAAGNDHILNGMLVTSGGSHYDVEYLGSFYHIKNQDTAWYRNDWNEFDISIPSVIEPIQSSNRLVEDLLNSTSGNQAAPNA